MHVAEIALGFVKSQLQTVTSQKAAEGTKSED